MVKGCEISGMFFVSFRDDQFPQHSSLLYSAINPISAPACLIFFSISIERFSRAMFDGTSQSLVQFPSQSP